jgi:hypothetical protein
VWREWKALSSECKGVIRFQVWSLVVLCEKVPNSKFPNWKAWCSIHPPLDLHTNWLVMLHEERSKDIMVWELRAELKVHAIISRQWGLQKQCVTAKEHLFKKLHLTKKKIPGCRDLPSKIPQRSKGSHKQCLTSLSTENNLSWTYVTIFTQGCYVHLFFWICSQFILVLSIVAQLTNWFDGQQKKRIVLMLKQCHLLQ